MSEEKTPGMRCLCCSRFYISSLTLILCVEKTSFAFTTSKRKREKPVIVRSFEERDQEVFIFIYINIGQGLTTQFYLKTLHIC